MFDSNADNVGLHPRNVYSSGELEERATTENFSVVQTEGRRRVRRTLKHYYLDATISIGYRVNTRRRVRFRQWATRTLRGHRVLGLPQPVLSRLLRGNFRGYSLVRLLHLLTALGRDIDIVIRQPHSPSGGKLRVVVEPV